MWFECWVFWSRRRRREKRGREQISVFPDALKVQQETLCTALRALCASGTEWKHEVFLHVQLYNFKLKKVIRTTSFSLNLHESIFLPMDGLCHSLEKKGLSHRQHFEAEWCASSVLSEAKYDKAGCSLCRTERNKSI